MNAPTKNPQASSGDGSDPIDRRRSPRAPCAIPMEYGFKDRSPRDGWITKIGTAGALLTTQEKIPVGGEMVLTFRLPLSNRPTRIVSTVKWANQHEVGVEFAHMTFQEQNEVWRIFARDSARQRESGD